MKRSKAYQNAAEKIDREQLYSPGQAVELASPHSVLVGARWSCREQKGRGQQQSREQALSHGDPHTKILRATLAKSSLSASFATRRPDSQKCLP